MIILECNTRFTEVDKMLVSVIQGIMWRRWL
jgi:hypothetical protein